LRLAAPDERGRLVRWWRAFYAEAEPLHPDDAEQAVAARFEDRALHVWEDGGEVEVGYRRFADWEDHRFTPPRR
jgi:hypothetical protein